MLREPGYEACEIMQRTCPHVIKPGRQLGSLVPPSTLALWEYHGGSAQGKEFGRPNQIAASHVTSDIMVYALLWDVCNIIMYKE